MSRIWINGFAQYEPGFDHLTVIQRIRPGLAKLKSDGKTNTALFSVLDGLRGTQKFWALQPADHRRLLLAKLLKQLMSLASFQPLQGTLIIIAKSQQVFIFIFWCCLAGDLLDILRSIHRVRESVADGSGKTSVAFDLTGPTGLVSIIDDGDAKEVTKLARLVVLAVLKGNAVIICSSGQQALDFAK